MRIGITYNLKDGLTPDAILDSESVEEFDTPQTIDAICGIFEKNGYEAVKLGGGINIIEKIKKERVDFVFNIAEGRFGRNRESHIPSILEMLEIPYSGSDPLTLGLTLDKIMTKKIAAQTGIPTAKYKVVKKIEDLTNIDKRLCYPLITKPAWEGSSKGIYNSSKVSDKDALERHVLFLFDKYPGQPILVEEYIKGKEITVGIIGNETPQVVGLMEIVNKISPGEDIFYSLDVKRQWKELVDYASPPDIGELLGKHIRHYAITAFKEFECRDVARIDFRISKNNKIFMLEINPLPGLSPEYADLAIMAGKQGIKYEDVLLSILKCALSRYGLAQEKDVIIKRDIGYETM
jgi:D-alanine-D-alanine ligase